MNTQARQKIRSFSLLAIIVLLGLFLQTWFAMRSPLNGDEAGVTLLQASGHAKGYPASMPSQVLPLKSVSQFITYERGLGPASVAASLRYAGMHPPLYYFIVHYALRFAGNEALTLRLISILASGSSIVALYFLAKKLFSDKVGLLSALIMAVSGYSVMYGSIVRPYPLAMLLALVSTLVMLKLADQKKLSLASPLFLIYVCLTAAGLYTIYQFFFVIVFQAVYLSLRFGPGKNLFSLSVCYALSALLFAPWLPALATQLADVTSREYYFHQNFDSGFFLLSIVNTNLTTFFHPRLFPIIIL